MKSALLKRKIQACYLRSGLLVLAVNLLLASASLAQLDDTRIAFMSTRSERNGEIFVMNPDGKRVRRLTKHPQYDAYPAWSPDGRKITFISFRDKNQFGEFISEIYLMNSDGTNLINLTQSPERNERAPDWSPDSKQIVFQSQGDIWVMDADGGNSHNLTNDDATRDMYPDWSPDGLQIVFTSDRNRAWEFEARDNWEIYVMEADGTNLINLTNHPARDRSPAWSPDGQQIAFTSNRDDNWEVYVMNADGTNLINLTNHPAGDGSPDWSPDGQQIAFTSGRDGDWEKEPNWEVYVMNADGTNLINLTNHPASDGLVSWGSVHPLNVSSNGRLVTLWGGIKRSNTYGMK